MRDQDQAENLARQIYGKRHAEDVLEIYRRSVLAKPYGYILMNLSLLTPDLLQIRSGIFGEPPCLGKYIMMLLPLAVLEVLRSYTERQRKMIPA